MALELRAVCHRMVAGWLLLTACSGSSGGSHDEDPSVIAARERQARADQAAIEQQAQEDAHAAELEQGVLAIESQPPDTLSDGQFLQVLEYHCGACHYPEPIASAGEQPFWLFFDDLHSMIRRSDVIPGDAKGSRIIVYLRERQDHIPPGSGMPPIPEIGITLIADYINSLPSTLEESSADR